MSSNLFESLIEFVNNLFKSLGLIKVKRRLRRTKERNKGENERGKERERNIEVLIDGRSSMPCMG